MAKIFISTAIFLIGCAACAQDSVRFNIRMSQNKNYIMQTVMVSSSKIDFIADVETPMKMEQETKLSMVSKIGSALENGDLPARLEYGKIISKTTVNGEQTVAEQPMSDMKILGRYIDGKTLEVDTIMGEQVTGQMRKMLTEMITGIQQRIKFPEDPVKIGESFESEVPLSIPLQGMNPIQIMVYTEYELKDITKGKAFLGLRQTISLNTGIEQVNIEATGSGNGTSEYDLEENYITKYESELPMELSVKVNDGLSMQIHSNTKTNYQVEIE